MIVERPIDRRLLETLTRQGCDPVLARLLAARGLDDMQALHPPLKALLPPQGLLGIEQAAALLKEAIERRMQILVVADYDCDGATACALLVRGLRRLGAQIDYLVPNRFEHGYGLTAPIIELARAHPRVPRPDLIVTVDNGIASVDGVAAARALGMRVLVTDHHLPGTQRPDADAIVNPNQTGCSFASKHLAGVGVALYVLLATRAAMRTAGAFAHDREPPLADLMDLVAVGTVADLVRLDTNNRALVNAGLAQIRAGRAQPGIRALLAVAGIEARHCTTEQIGFGLGPRINAAGRLEDITIGIACLLTDDPHEAQALALRLDQINRERRRIETGMRDQAFELIDEHDNHGRSVCLFHEQWHEGVVGLVASRAKDRLHRPVFAFAPSAQDPQSLRGSGRSISGIHLRDALDLVSKHEPDLIERFGGHAMAAGLTLQRDRLERFRAAIERAVVHYSDLSLFKRETATDGPLPESAWTLTLARQLANICWGQGFPEPVFSDQFDVITQRLVQDRHSKLRLRLPGGRQIIEAIYFNHNQPLPGRCRLAYQIGINEFNGAQRLEFRVREAEAAG